MEIIQKIVPVERRPKYNLNGHLVEFPMKPEYITIHETANTAKGANDLAHANLQYNGNSRQASWHLQVDEDSCYQSLPFNVAGMHAGDGWEGTGNRKSIALEICVNSDGNYEKAVKNAAEVTSQLMKQFNIPIDRVVPHKKWSGKNCPTRLLPRWNEFLGMIKADKPYKVVVPNTAFWQAKGLVSEYEHRGFKCEGVNLKAYGPGQQPQDHDPYLFVLYTGLETAKQIVIELHHKGYDKAYGEEL